jgi:hypothetical protein
MSPLFPYNFDFSKKYGGSKTGLSGSATNADSTNSKKSALWISMSAKSRAAIRSMDDGVNRPLLASCENPPDRVDPLNEHRFSIKCV